MPTNVQLSSKFGKVILCGVAMDDVLGLAVESYMQRVIPVLNSWTLLCIL